MLTYPNPAKLEPNRKRLNHKGTKTQSVKAYESTFCAACLPSGMHAETSVDKKGTVSLFRSEESKLSPFFFLSCSALNQSVLFFYILRDFVPLW